MAATAVGKENCLPAATLPSVAVGCGTLSVDQIALLSDEDVTVEMLAVYAAKLSAAEHKIRELSESNKRKAPASVFGQNQPLANKAPKASETAKDVTAKRRDMIVKKVITASKQSLKGVKFFSGWEATGREAKAQDLISKAEFDAVFSNGGTLIQPTAQNKPKSKVTIREYTSAEAKQLLGSAAEALKGELWIKGGAPSRGFSMFGGGGFAKGRKKGSTPLDVTSMKVTYSADAQKLSVVISVVNRDADDDSDGCW